MEINHDGQYSVKCKNRNIIDSVISTVASASASLVVVVGAEKIINNSATLDNNRNRLGAIKLYSNRNENSITFFSLCSFMLCCRMSLCRNPFVVFIEISQFLFIFVVTSDVESTTVAWMMKD